MDILSTITLKQALSSLPMFVIVPIAVVLAVVILHGLIKFIARYFLQILLVMLFVVCAYAVFVYAVRG